MRALVTFAMNAEFSQWKSRHSFVPYEFDFAGGRRDFDLFRANLGVHEVTVLLTARGRENAGNAMRTVNLELYDLCISTGLAGALDPNLKPGAIVVARTAETLDQACKCESDAHLLALAAASGARAVDVFLTSETIVATAAEKETLRVSGSVVEMESSYILSVARRAQLPVVAIRAISDAADEDLPVDFQRIADSRGHLKVGELLKELALHPHRLPLLLQFGRQSRSATFALADFLDRYIPAIAGQRHFLRTIPTEEISAI